MIAITTSNSIKVNPFFFINSHLLVIKLDWDEICLVQKKEISDSRCKITYIVGWEF